MNRLETGREVLRSLMGADYLAQRDARRTDFNATIQDYADEVCFGMVWSRPGIDPKLRSMLNVAILTAMGRPNQLRTHVEGALNNGCSIEELREILLHTAVYAGLPAAVDAFRVTEEVIRKA